MVPDLFELGNDSALQLAKCLSTTATDPTNSITFDVLGKNTSFYHCVCEELHAQDADAFASVIGEVVKYLTDALSKCKSLLDEGSKGLNEDEVRGSGLLLTSALRELCTNKKALVTMTKLPSFLLPAAGTARASERVETLSGQQLAMLRMMNSMRGDSGPVQNGHLRRSGPALEKDTVLGLVLRLGLPCDHTSTAYADVVAAFPNPASRNPKDIANTCDGFRRQLELYQSKCNELLKSLVVAGEEPRKRVSLLF